MNTQVAIHCGGLAGLSAVRLLHRAGVDFILLEGRDRPGGRLLTVNEDDRPAEDGFDLGPSWFLAGAAAGHGPLGMEGQRQRWHGTRAGGAA